MIIAVPTGIKIFVRHTRRICSVWISHNNCCHVIAPSGLGEGENAQPNIASLSKAIGDTNWSTSIPSQGVLPMIRATLLKAKSPMPPLNGEQHDQYGLFRTLLVMKTWTNRAAVPAYSSIRRSKEMSLQSKGSMWTNTATMGLSKGSNPQGNGVWIVPAYLKRTYGPASVGRRGSHTVRPSSSPRHYSTGSVNNVMSRLDDLSRWCSEHPEKSVDRKLHKLMSDPALLEYAYNQIKSKPGNMTPGITPETLDGISYEYLTGVAESLKDETFTFEPGRRIQIPKADGTSTRPLTIAPPRDKIVQEAMRIILSSIYEPTFKDSSHGFRNNRSCHSALKYIYVKFKPCTWMIEGDISKCFDSIDHKKLMNLIEDKILDRQFTKLIWKSLKAGYLEFRRYQHNIAGTSQGSIISPILSNIFLHQLDVFVENLQINFEKGSRPRNTKEYDHKRYLMKTAKKRGDIVTVNQILKDTAHIPVMDFSDPLYKRLKYVRYADDWIIGVRGSLKEAEEILAQTSKFCSEIGLTVNTKKTKITNLNQDRTFFLGVNIFRSRVTKTDDNKQLTGATQRLNRQLRLTAPLDHIRKKLRQAGFIKGVKPHPKFPWLPLSHKQIIYLYNSVFRGYMNYYSFAHNYGRMVGLLNLYLIRSAAKLLAAKFKLRSTAKVFNKFGKNLASEEVAFLKPSYTTDINRFSVKPDPVIKSLESL